MKSMNSNGGRKQRRNRGTSIIEVPVSIWMVFVMLLMPMLGLASITLRVALMNAVVQDAAHSASRGKTFDTATPGKPSVKDLAKATVLETLKKFSGLSVNSIDSDILITNIENGDVTRSEEKLTTPADSSRFIYQVEVAVKGRIDPIFGTDASFFGRVPGLTEAMPIAYVARQMAETPQGLDK